MVDRAPGRTDEERAYYSLNRRVYAKFAPFYDLVVMPLRRLRRQVVQIAGADPTSKVLDVATGTGAQAAAFAEQCREVVGIDLSPAMLRVARRKHQRPNLTFLEADATELPFDDARFDVSCISFALHEMPASVRDRVVREMARVTRRGGTVVVVDYALPANRAARALVYRLVKLYERDHYADFVRSDVQALLRGAGIDPQEERAALLGAARVVTGFNVAAAGSVYVSDQSHAVTH